MILHIINVLDTTVLLLFSLYTVNLTAIVKLTVTPSQNVEANESVLLKCEADSYDGLPVMNFIKEPQFALCTLEYRNGQCKDPTTCLTQSSASCYNETVFSIRVPIPFDWNGKKLWCSTALVKSNNIILTVTVQVTKVTLMPVSITGEVGDQMYLSCTTSFCFPQANVSWFISSTDITNQSTPTTNSDSGLSRTNSTLILSLSKAHNGKQVYCAASNKPNQIVNSLTHTVTVFYKPELTSNTSRTYTVSEGGTAILECTLFDANPNTGITWRWFKLDDPNLDLYDGSSYTIQNIQRKQSGSYNCTAKNTAGTSDAIEIEVDVQYKPDITSDTTSPYTVTEGNTATLQCSVDAANPKTNYIWKWFNTASPSKILHNGPTFSMFNIKRDKSGSYNCTAENSVGISNAITIEVDVQYKPEIKPITQSPYRVSEGKPATLQCALTAANPNTSITWNWLKNDRSEVLNSMANYTISSIQRAMSGSYNCTATNSVGTSAAISIEVDVQYKPKIEDNPSIIVNESEKLILTREIDSNPLSNVSWYNGSQFVYTQFSVKKATLIIEKASCTDTTNFTILASNTEETNVTAMVELFVNCKPKPYVTNITLGVTDTTGIEFSTTIIAYPEPKYELRYENGTKNVQMMDSITRNSLYNVTIHFNQTAVEQSDYGKYYLLLHNLFGKAYVFVNVIPQRKPTMPIIEKSYCEVTRAKIQWTSSFNGGDIQFFTVIALNSQQQQSKSDNISDKGENEVHSTYVQNLQPSTTYVFYVSAQNRHGLSSSEHISCTTKEVSSDSFPMIVGGATAGGITLAIVVVVLIILLRRYTKHEKQTVKSERLHQDGESDITNDDGMRDNILYVSAGPKVDEKPEAAVYAAVNKKVPESNNNANVYAEVKEKGNIIPEGALYSDVKPKRGFFKKDVSGKKDGNPKQKKGKKQKSKQDVADVYENSEDFAMSSKSDNVYSNTGQKVQNKEERGYKNKDGLLYVEVQFDAKTEKGNQTIHGEDEKTDYATVEFPMAASKHDE